MTKKIHARRVKLKVIRAVENWTHGSGYILCSIKQHKLLATHPADYARPAHHGAARAYRSWSF